MKEPVWIREIEALAFHAQQIAFFGGSDGVRDRGLLNSALARPKNRFAYAEGALTMAELAAAYAKGISSNHPFVDGNKRTAMEVAFVFLEFNGIAVTASQEEACMAFLTLAAGEITEVELALWFAEHTAAL
ncbi:MAG: type II toxin-antitoxin system death-on-curing family toxin [Terracidiphilus sp.]|nr:type II toxin-antitoxin system death-on-curing family toxin [Terracidiphilus sp.]